MHFVEIFSCFGETKGRILPNSPFNVSCNGSYHCILIFTFLSLINSYYDGAKNLLILTFISEEKNWKIKKKVKIFYLNLSLFVLFLVLVNIALVR
jgi:hypothetical protein